ncbi:MAG: MarR family transcriptional regulator, partial [Rhodospirillales bacterium]|nr:MarR family transcriptional regulator [Acetobacter sp.]
MDAEKKDKRVEARRISEAMRDLLTVFRNRFEEEFRASGVTLAQLRLLKAVQRQKERSAASIARECHVTPQTLHTMLSRAVREG